MAGPMSSQPSAIASISNDPLRDPLDSSLPPRPTISSLPSAQVETGTKAPTKTKRCREDGLTKRQRYRARKAQRPQQNVAQTLELGGGTTMVTSGVNDATMQRGEVQGEPKPTRMCLPKDISSVPQTILASAAHDPRDSRALPPSPPTTPEPQSSEGHMHDPSSSSHTTPSGQKWHVPLQSPFVDAHATSARTRRSHPDWSFPDDTPILRYDTPPLTPAVMLKRPGSGKRARSSDMEISSGAGEKRVRIQRKLPWTASVCRGSSQDVSDDPDPARPFLFKPELAPATLGPALSIAASHPAQHDSARLSASQQADLDRSRANYMVAKKHIDMLSHRVRDEHKKRMALEEKLSAAHKERRAVDERLNEMRKVVANLEAERNANLAAKSKDEVRKMYAGGAKGVLQKAEDSVGAVADSGVVAEQKGKSVREQLIDIGDHLRHLETRLSSSSPGDPEPSPRPELAYDCTSIDTSARRITPSDAPTVDTSVNMAYEDRKILRQTEGKLKQARLRIAELERLVSQYIVSTLELMSENIALRRRY